MTRFRPIRYFFQVVVWIVRGIPLMLQLFIVYYVPGFIIGYTPFDRFTAVVVAFVLNYACYFSEIYRSGIQSIPKGQTEAGQVLGMTKSQIFFKVILMQVVKRIIPPMGNEIITLVKDTALSRVISVFEIIYQAEMLMSKAIIWPMFYTGVFYLIFVGVLTLLFGYLEKRLNYYKI